MQKPDKNVEDTFFSIWFYILPPLAALFLGIYYSRVKRKSKKEMPHVEVLTGNDNKPRIAMWESAKKNKIWIFINIVSLIFYIWVSSSNWPQLTNEGYFVSGNMALVWGFTAFPILVLMQLANVIWVSFSLGRKNWPDLLLGILIFFGWFYVHLIGNIIWFDFLKAKFE